MLPTDRIVGEAVIGLLPGSEIESTAAVEELLSRASLLRGAKLLAPTPGGDRVANPDLAQRISDELAQRLGGWFAQDLTRYIQLYDNLVSRAEREEYRRGGMPARWDETKTAFYHLAFQVDSWHVYVVGEPGTFHAVFLGLPLAPPEAIGAGGHPVVRPVGAIAPLLGRAAPRVLLRPVDDRSAGHAKNVFDTYLVGDGLVVKAGVRMRIAEGGTAYSGAKAYFYGIRINIDLRKPIPAGAPTPAQ